MPVSGAGSPGSELPSRLYHPLGVAVSPEGDLVAVSDQGLDSAADLRPAAGKLHTVSRDDLGERRRVALEGDRVWVIVPQRKGLAYGRDGRPQRTIELGDCERPLGLAIDVERRLLYATDLSPPGRGHSVHVHS
jgi:hypothetical protein